MRDFSATSAAVLLLVGAVVFASVVSLTRPPVRPGAPDAMSFWEAAGRGLVTVTVVNETYERDGETVTLLAELPVLQGEIVDATYMSAANLHAFLENALAKAKAARSVAEKIVTLGKTGTIHARRLATARLHARGPGVQMTKAEKQKWPGRTK